MSEENLPLPYDGRAAAAHLAASGPAMAALVAEAGPLTLTLRPWTDSFHPLLRSIVYQQLSGKAAATIYGRVQALTAGSEIQPQDVLSLTDEALRGAGLSRNKIAAARDLATRCVAGLIPSPAELHTMPDEAIIDRLTQVRGIGQWTVEMLLIFSLGRPDVLPVTDLGVRKGFKRIYRLDDLPTPGELMAAGETWRPFRSVASWYLWRAVDLTELP